MDYYKVQGQAIEDRDETAWAKEAVTLEEAEHPAMDKRRRASSVVSKKALKEERKPAPPQKQPQKKRAKRARQAQAAARKPAAAPPRKAAPKARKTPAGAQATAVTPKRIAKPAAKPVAARPQPPRPQPQPPPMPAAHERPVAEQQQPSTAYRLARGAFQLATAVPRGLFHAAGGAVQAARSAVGLLRREDGGSDES